MIAYTYPLLNIMWTMFVFFALFAWIWVLISIFTDIFRSPDLSGVAKALWFVGVLVLPLVGAVVYLIARGHKMHEHAVQAAEQQDQAFRQYVRDAAKTDGSTADELSKLADLARRGVITQAEFEQQKAKLLEKEPVEKEPVLH